MIGDLLSGKTKSKMLLQLCLKTMLINLLTIYFF